MAMGGIHFIQGIDYTFDDGVELAPGAFCGFGAGCRGFCLALPRSPFNGCLWRAIEQWW